MCVTDQIVAGSTREGQRRGVSAAMNLSSVRGTAMGVVAWGNFAAISAGGAGGAMGKNEGEEQREGGQTFHGPGNQQKELAVAAGLIARKIAARALSPSTSRFHF